MTNEEFYKRKEIVYRNIINYIKKANEEQLMELAKALDAYHQEYIIDSWDNLNEFYYDTVTYSP